jgi:Protein of unknown function (DUF3631)
MNEEETCILDEVAEFYDRFVVIDPVKRDAAVLFAGVTWAQKALFTLPRFMFTSEETGLEETGKTTAMNVTAALSANAEEADGSYAALRSALMAADGTPEDSLRLWTFDAIDATVFGESGQNAGNNATLIKLLEKGYKKGAHESISVRGTKKSIPLFYPVIMTGKGVTLRRDLRSRTVVVRIESGTPQEYFDARVAEPDARKQGEALGKEVRLHLKEIGDFRADGIHPRLIKRKQEVWEPLFAVAWHLGGQRWLNRCRDAFELLALDSGTQALSLRQETLRDASSVLDKIPVRVIPNGALVGRQFAGGLVLAREIGRLPGYEEKSDLAVAQDIARYMRPVTPRQVRFGKEVISGYLADDIRAAWEAARPQDPDDATLAEEVNPFDVTIEAVA